MAIKLVKTAWGDKEKKSVGTKARELLSKGLIAGGNALTAHGAVNPVVQSQATAKTLEEQPMTPHEELRDDMPKDTEVLTDRDDIRGRFRDLSGYHYMGPVMQWLMDQQYEPVLDSIEKGSNAMYMPGNIRYPKGTFLLPPYGINPSIFYHEIGHANADARHENYNGILNRARFYDSFGIPWPSDMFRSPSQSTYFGEPYMTLPGIEREAWDMAPHQDQINPDLREAALKTYTAEREGRAKRFYGNMGILAGNLIKPKDKKQKKKK